MALRPIVLNNKLEANGITPIKNFHELLETYKLCMYRKSVYFNLFLFLRYKKKT